MTGKDGEPEPSDSSNSRTCDSCHIFGQLHEGIGVKNTFYLDHHLLSQSYMVVKYKWFAYQTFWW